MIEFLSPSVLWALTLLSIPVILHFLKNINPKIFQFSSISFFKDLQKKNLKRLSILQYLLLLLRLLFLLFLILSFARPGWRSVTDISLADKTVFIDIDRSFSTYLNSNEEKPGQVFLNLLESLSYTQNSQTLYHVSGTHLDDFQETSMPLEKIRGLVQNKTGFTSDNLWRRLQHIQKSLPLGRKSVIIVFTDFQVPETRDSTRLDNLIDDISTGNDLFFVHYPYREKPEQGIIRIADFRYAKKPSPAVDMAIETNVPAPVDATFYNAETRIAQKYLNAKTEQNVRIEIANLKRISGVVELENDPFSGDNHFYWGIDLSKPTRVLLAGDTLALAMIKSIISIDDFSDNIQFRTRSSRGLYAESADNWDWLFLAPDLWNTDFNTLIQRFKRERMKIFLIPGKEPLLFSQALNDLCHLQGEWVQLQGDEQAGIKNRTFSPSLADYPIRAFVQSYYKLKSPALLRLDNGSPVIGQKYGYIFLTVPPLKNNGNIRFHPGLPMWLINWIPQQSRVNAFYSQVTAGRDSLLDIPNSWKRYPEISLQGPGGTFALQPQRGMIFIPGDDILTPGNYRLSAAGEDLFFSVNTDVKEFDKRFYQPPNAAYLDKSYRAKQTIELWKYTLLLALLFLAAETFIRHKYSDFGA